MMINHLNVIVGESTEVRIIPCPETGEDVIQYAFHMEKKSFPLGEGGAGKIQCCRCNITAQQFMQIMSDAITRDKRSVSGCGRHTEHKWAID